MTEAIRGVLFDVDDTLVDTRAAFGEALAEVARRTLPDLGPDGASRLLARWRADVGGHYRKYTRGEVDYHTQRRARADDLRALADAPPLDDAGYAEFSEIFDAAFAAAWRPMPGAAAVLHDLRKAGFAVGALSNAASDLQTRKLAAAGLDAPLLVGIDTLGVGKPDPRVFALGCERLGTSARETAYVGDEFDIDADAAARCGLMGLWFRHETGRNGPTEAEIAASRAIVITGLDQVIDVVATGRAICDENVMTRM